jgi:hypothetical protein
VERLDADLELKTVDVPQRLISGYACIHQTADRVRDIIDPIASAKAVARLGSPQDIAVFVGHDTKSLPVGIPQTIQATPQGLYTETYILKGSAGDNLLANRKPARQQPNGLYPYVRLLVSRPHIAPAAAELVAAGGKRLERERTITEASPPPSFLGPVPTVGDLTEQYCTELAAIKQAHPEFVDQQRIDWMIMKTLASRVAPQGTVAGGDR